MRYIDNMDISGKRLLLRVDLNVPVDRGKVADDSRIRAVLPTIHYALDNGSRLVIVSHLDRPGGKVDPRFSLEPVCGRLSELLGSPVRFVPAVRGPMVEEAVRDLAPGSAIMLENVRFDPGEESNDRDFARDLASLADVYIDDAFADAHRCHASNVGVTDFVPVSGGGFLMRREMSTLTRALDNPERPLVVAIGGAKVKSKMAVIENLSMRADRILLGGLMALPFLMAQGRFDGEHDFGEDLVMEAGRIMDKGGRDKFLLPRDLVALEEGAEDPLHILASEDVRPGMKVMDIGPATIEEFSMVLRSAMTIVWNGPMGAFEDDAFRHGTRAVAEVIAESPAFSLVGGGDTGRALERFGFQNSYSYVSTGGGAFLELMGGRELPAVRALQASEGKGRATMPGRTA
jgi:3-phosphoglycerate kinase